MSKSRKVHYLDPSQRYPILAAVALACVRAGPWKIPRNWSRWDWRRELSLVGDYALLALQRYDPDKGVPFGRFAKRLINARLLTRHRQEWLFSGKCVIEVGQLDEPGDSDEAVPCNVAAVTVPETEADHARFEGVRLDTTRTQGSRHQPAPVSKNI
jgi:hypothetical protein